MKSEEKEEEERQIKTEKQELKTRRKCSNTRKN
jgi:hypothetical protein